MIRLARLLISGTVFTMCNGGPVPEGCCERGDQLNVVLHEGSPTSFDTDLCVDWGSVLVFVNNTTTCEGVDF